MSKAKDILIPISEGCDDCVEMPVDLPPVEASGKDVTAPPDFLEICESIHKALLDTVYMLQNAAERIQFYVEEAKKG